MKEISFIIPAYNAGKTIGETLSSIVASVALGVASYEVIVVDDHSSDDTVAVAESFSVRIPNLLILKQPVNGRQGAARNRGVEAAEGRYIMFVDSDDRLLEGINDTLNFAKKTDADICLSPIFREAENRMWALGDSPDFVEDGSTFCERIFNPSFPMLLSPCSGIYRLEFVRNVNYPFVENHQAEDTDFVLKHFASARRVCYCHSPSYYYSDNKQSTVNRRNWHIVSDYFLMAERLIDISECVHSSLPSYSEVLRTQVVPIAVSRMAIWYVGKLDLKGLFSFYLDFGRERRFKICSVGLSGFPLIFFKHKWISIGCVIVYKCFHSARK